MTNWTPCTDGLEGPRYRVIADAIARDVAEGRLSGGARMPTHRDLAHRLGVTVGTVTRAYAEAEKRGLIGGEVGRGTFVLAPKATTARDTLTWPPKMPSDGPAAMVNMTVVMPPQIQAAGALAATLREMADDADAIELMGYAPHAGLPRHRRAGAEWLNRRHRTQLRDGEVLITTGAQNAMAVAMAAVARPGDVVLTEHLTNYGAKTLANTLGLLLEGVAMDDEGLRPDAFDAACRRLGPRALYSVPTLHNPTGAIASPERRREIIDIARRHEVVILEDDVFGFLDDDAVPYQALAPDITVFMTSLSKSVASGLRVGYVSAPEALFPRLEATVRALHYSAPPLPVEVATRWIVGGQADQFCESQRVEAHRRQKLARRILPPQLVRGSDKGEHLWMVLPEPWRRDDFIAEARRRGVMVTGADTFTVGRTMAPHAVRVSVAMPPTVGDVERGVRILADLAIQPAAMALSIL